MCSYYFRLDKLRFLRYYNHASCVYKHIIQSNLRHVKRNIVK
nr:MAG TPA: hypothetical protein [Caudoviricetes sp.]